MLSSEKELKKPDQCKYTPEWIKMLSMIRYLKLLKREENGTILNKKVIENAKGKENTSFKSRSQSEIQKKKQETNRKMREYMQEYQQKREYFMDKFLTEAQKADDTKRAKEIKEIKHRKESSQRAHKIKTAMGRHKKINLPR